MTKDEFHSQLTKWYGLEKGKFKFSSFNSIGGGGRCGENNLIDLFKRLNYRTGAEIGVFEGANSNNLCSQFEGPIYVIDPWKHFPDGAYPEGDITNPAQEKLDRRYEGVERLLSQHSHAIILRKESIEALVNVENGALDFVYIDANHTLPFIWCDIRGWWPKIKEGGILSGHDYGWRGIGTAVDAFAKEKGLNVYLAANAPLTDWFIYKCSSTE